MTPDAARLIRDALTLDADQRAVVANALIESIKDDDQTNEIAAAWKDEAVRRLDEVRSGQVTLVDADDHFAQVRASLSA